MESSNSECHLFQNGIDQTYTRRIWHGELNTESLSPAEGTTNFDSVDQIPINMENSDSDNDVSIDSSDFFYHVINMNHFIRDVKDLQR